MESLILLTPKIIPNMKAINLRANIVTYIRTLSCLRISSKGSQPISVNIIKVVPLNQYNGLSRRGSFPSARTPSKPILAILRIIWIVGLVKGPHLLPFQKTKFYRKANSMEIAIIIKISWVLQQRDRSSLSLLGSLKLERVLSKVFRAITMIF